MAALAASEGQLALRPEHEAKLVYLRAFREEGGLVRLDVSEEGDEGERLQLVVPADDLLRRISEPQ